MAEKTAIQNLIDELKQFKKFPMVDQPTIDAAIEFAELRIKMQEEQIKMAYNKGYQDGEIDSLDAKDGDVQFFEDADQYYRQTYGTDPN
jgi:Zn/Cd-binding protein ZinT